MTAQYFIDTNVLLYAGSGATEDQAKKAIARQVLAQADIGFSAQVMQEFYYAAVRKERLKITHDEAVLILEALSPFPVLPVSREMVLEAVELSGINFRIGTRPSLLRHSLPAIPSTVKTSITDRIMTESRL